MASSEHRSGRRHAGALFRPEGEHRTSLERSRLDGTKRRAPPWVAWPPASTGAGGDTLARSFGPKGNTELLWREADLMEPNEGLHRGWHGLQRAQERAARRWRALSARRGTQNFSGEKQT